MIHPLQTVKKTPRSHEANGAFYFISQISTELLLLTFLPLQGGGQEGDGAMVFSHPHPNPPLEGEGVFLSGRMT